MIISDERMAELIMDRVEKLRERAVRGDLDAQEELAVMIWCNAAPDDHASRQSGCETMAFVLDKRARIDAYNDWAQNRDKILAAGATVH